MSSLVELSSCSHLVVGAGIIGSWTAWHLQRELGEAGRVALVDSFPLPHTRGSSHGGSRVIRFLGDDDLAKLDYSLDTSQRGSSTLVNASPPPGSAGIATSSNTWGCWRRQASPTSGLGLRR